MTTAFDAIKLQENEKVKVWDVLLTPKGIRLPWQLTTQQGLDDYSTDESIPRIFWQFIGRIRILAVVPKLPGELKNIRFSIAYCAPSDLHRYNRVRANAICVGRWNKAFTNNKQDLPTNHTGIIPELVSLKREDVVEAALFNVNGHLPQWVHMCTFTEDGNLEKRIDKEYIDE